MHAEPGDFSQPRRTPSPGKDPKPMLVFHVNDSTDDQVLFQTACKQAAVPFGWHVADSAQKALSYLKALVEMNRNYAAPWPDLVVLDIHMPGGSGFEVLEYIRATPELRRMPVIVFTGHPDPSYIKKAYELGANSFLTKPQQFQNTVELVSSLYHTWSRMQRPALGA